MFIFYDEESKTPKKHPPEEPKKLAAKKPHPDEAHVTHEIAPPPDLPHHIKHAISPADAVEEKLRAIYEEDGALPDFSKLDRKRPRRWLGALVGLVLLGSIAGAAWIGFLVFGPMVSHPTPKLVVTIDAPEEIASLETFTVTLAYENDSPQPITNVSLRANLPPEFEIKSSKPALSSDSSEWFVGSLDPGAKGKIELEGSLLAAPGSNALFQTITKYRPGNFNADFQDIASKSVILAGSKLKVAIDAPTEVAAGDKFTATYSVTNDSKYELPTITLVPTIPDSLLVDKTDPALNDANEIILEKLAAGETRKVTLNGTFSSNHGESENLGAKIKAKRVGATTAQSETVTSIKVLASDLEFRLIVNGTNSDSASDFGSKLRLSMIVKNNGKQPIKNLNLSATLDATPDNLIDWAAFDKETIDDKSFQHKGESILITPKLNQNFEVVVHGTEGTYSFTLPLAKTAPADGKVFSVVVTGKAWAMTGSNFRTKKEVETAPFTIRMNSDVAMNAEARYFDKEGLPLGSGQLPPKVGEKTKFLVNWNLTNSIHELKDLELKAQLPEGVEWTGTSLAEAGAVGYELVTRTVTWKLQKLPTTMKSVNVQFEVELTPSQSQYDNFAPLLTSTSLSAVDSVTGTLISQSADALTTELPTDTHAKGKGLVVK